MTPADLPRLVEGPHSLVRRARGQESVRLLADGWAVVIEYSSPLDFEPLDEERHRTKTEALASLGQSTATGFEIRPELDPEFSS